MLVVNDFVTILLYLSNQLKRHYRTFACSELSDLVVVKQVYTEPSCSVVGYLILLW